MASSQDPARGLTIAVIDYQARGYPQECLKSLGAGEPGRGTEYLLVTGAGHGRWAAPAGVMPEVRRIEVAEGDRASAKNRAVAEASGAFILLVASDTLAKAGAAARLQAFLEGHAGEAVASGQLLLENGMPRRTAYRFPSLRREVNCFHWMWRWRRWVRGKLGARRVPRLVSADALHADFLMGRREVFERIGPFREGYRFGYEDVEWCWRARQKGIGRYVLSEAQAFRMPPQLFGELPLEVRLAMEASLFRMVRATRGRGYAGLLCGVRRAKSLGKWVLCGMADRVLCGRSALLAQEAAVHGAIWRRGVSAGRPAPDVESHVRWEDAV